MKSRVRLYSSAGFTLLELSIVLVIIGLLVGGVLVGRDLIQAGELRGTTTQYDKYRSAMQVFNMKYDGYPGDLQIRKAQRFGFFSNGMDGTGGLGNGDRLLQNDDQDCCDQRGEVLVFWRHLTEAGLVDGRYGSTLTLYGNPVIGEGPELYFPAAKLQANYFIVHSDDVLNYFQLTGSGNIVSTNGWLEASPRITPADAYNLDAKIDDGLPMSGIVRAIGGALDVWPGQIDPPWSTATAANAARGDCVTGGADPASPDNIYALNAAAAKSFACRLTIEIK